MIDQGVTAKMAPDFSADSSGRRGDLRPLIGRRNKQGLVCKMPTLRSHRFGISEIRFHVHRAPDFLSSPRADHEMEYEVCAHKPSLSVVSIVSPV